MNNIAQSNPDGELERLGQTSKNVTEQEQGVEVEPLKEPVKGLRREKTSKKTKKWPVVILTVIAILGVALGVVMTILWLEEKEKNPVIEVTEKTEIVEVGDAVIVTTESDGENERKIKELLAELAEKIPEWTSIQTSMGVKMPPRITYTYDMGYPILYRPEGFKISVILDRTYGLMLDSNNYTDSMDLRNRYINEFLTVMPEKIREYLKNKGFSQYDEYDTEYMNSDGIVCQIGTSWPDSAIHCAYKGWYDAKIAAFSNEVAVGTDFPVGEYLGLNPDGLNIHDSKYAPYQTMTGGILGAAGLWYRVSPDAPWQWFVGTQGVLECEEYDTDDLRKAFAGEMCYKNGELEVVEVE